MPKWSVKQAHINPQTGRPWTTAELAKFAVNEDTGLQDQLQDDDSWFQADRGEYVTAGKIREENRDWFDEQEITGGPADSRPMDQPAFTGDVRALWEQYRAENPGFRPRQSVPGSLNPFIEWANGRGANISLAAPGSYNMEKGIMANGKFVKLLDGSDNPMWEDYANGSDEGGGGGEGLGGLAAGSPRQPFARPCDP